MLSFTKLPTLGLRVGRVRVLFSLPMLSLFDRSRILPPNVDIPKHLAYVEWFTKFPRSPDPHSKLYQIRHDISATGGPLASVLPVSRLQQSIHLFPKWGNSVPQEWTSQNVLDKAAGFFVSQFNTRYTYFNLSE